MRREVWRGNDLAAKERKQGMRNLVFAAVAALATVGAANAAATWTFDASSMTGTTHNQVKDGFNATTVGGTSGNPVGAGYATYYIWGVDNNTMASKANDVLAGLRAGLSMEQTISTKGLIVLASSTTDKDGYVKSVTESVDEDLYCEAFGTTVLSLAIAILGENDVYLAENWPLARSHSLNGDVWLTNTRRDIDGTAKYGGSWGWYAVPEPTSGLLLLLGVAGLALKRKRA